MGRFDGKAVLVSGGGTGIGRAIALAFAREGARVAVSGRRKEPLLALVAELGKQAIAVQGDVTAPADRKRVIAEAVRALGGLDVLVNNAGVYASKPLSETTDEELDQLFQVNVVGLLGLTREALPHLQRSKGNVVNVSSVVATGVAPGTAAYSATKAAVDQLTRVLAAELGATGVRVNAVSPGLTETDMAAPLTTNPAARQAMVTQTPLGRLGQPEDIARVVTFLASPEAGWVTGQAVQASGGLLL